VTEGVVPMEEIVDESVQLVTRVCAIDIGKAGLVACVRVPHTRRPDRRVQEVREYTTVTPALLELADWLRVGCQPAFPGAARFGSRGDQTNDHQIVGRTSTPARVHSSSATSSPPQRTAIGERLPTYRRTGTYHL
jgi:hypothetical protein